PGGRRAEPRDLGAFGQRPRRVALLPVGGLGEVGGEERVDESAVQHGGRGYPTTRWVPLYTFMEEPRRNPTSVIPISPASSTASDDGADTAASTGTPAIAAFCTSSNDARPDTISTVPAAGTRFSSNAQPRVLSRSEE